MGISINCSSSFQKYQLKCKLANNKDVHCAMLVSRKIALRIHIVSHVFYVHTQIHTHTDSRIRLTVYLCIVGICGFSLFFILLSWFGYIDCVSER